MMLKWGNAHHENTHMLINQTEVAFHFETLEQGWAGRALESSERIGEKSKPLGASDLSRKGLTGAKDETSCYDVN